MDPDPGIFLWIFVTYLYTAHYGYSLGGATLLVVWTLC